MNKLLVGTLIGALLPLTAAAHEDQDVRDRLAALEERVNEHRAFHNKELTDFEKSVFLASGMIAELFVEAHNCERHQHQKSCERMNELMEEVDAMPIFRDGDQ